MTRTKAIAITALFAALSAISLSCHEMWLDELQAYLLATDTDIPEFFRLLHYEAHPGLWHLLVRLGTLAYKAPVTMQVLHWFVAVSAVWLFTRFAPFSVVEKILFVFGYYQSYEYAVISRNYGIGWLFLIAAWLLLKHGRLIAAACCLAAAAHSNLFAWIIVLAFVASRAAELLLRRFQGDTVKIPVTRREYTAHTIVVLGLLLSFLSMYPAPDYGFHLFADHRPDLQKAFNTVATGFLPIFDRTIWFSRSNWYNHLLSESALTALSIAICTWTWFQLRSSVRASVFFLIAATGMLIFFYAFYSGQVRHHGHLFLAFLSAIWLARDREDSAADAKLYARSFPLLIILAFQALQGLAAHTADIQRPFSQAQATADFLRRPDFADSILVADPDYHVTAVSGYLGRRLVSSKNGRAQSYMVWNMASYGFPPTLRVLQTLDMFPGRRVLLIVAGRRRAEEFRGASLRKLAAFEGAIIPNEDFYIFEYVPPKPQAVRP